jgi:branched-chain amino acid transport system substrate-binding protein
MNARRAFVASCLFSAIALAYPAVHAADKPSIKIGVILPLSGFQASYGEMYRTTFAMAVEEINKAGGINGSRIELLVDDDQGRAEQAVTPGTCRKASWPSLAYRQHHLEQVAPLSN